MSHELHSDFRLNQQSVLHRSGHMNVERRFDCHLAAAVKKGFEINFSQGFRVAGEFLRNYGVPPKVVGRVINYGARRTSDCEP